MYCVHTLNSNISAFGNCVYYQQVYHCMIMHIYVVVYRKSVSLHWISANSTGFRVFWKGMDKKNLELYECPIYGYLYCSQCF